MAAAEMAGNEGRMVDMHDSTVFRDLALYLEREAKRFEQLGDYYWAGDLSAAAGELLKRAEQLAEAEPLLPSEVSCRECGEPVERDDVVFHEECLDPAIIAARAALKQGEIGSG